MTAGEPQRIAARLATRLGREICRWPAHGEVGDRVALLDERRLGEIPAAQLAGAAAVVVVGVEAPASSAGLRALREAVEGRGIAVALASFATVARDDGPVQTPLVVAAPLGDERVAALLAAGPHALTLDAAVPLDAVSPDDPPARVCVVSFEVSGMTGGGIGTASTSLTETLARHGHDVTLLFTGWQDAGGGEDNARWQAHYADRGVQVELLRPPGVNTVKCPHFPARSAYEVYRWLRRNGPFDVVHLPENMGHGAYAQLAKRQGEAFAETTFVVGTHGPTRWAAEANRVALTREEFLVNDALERLSVAHADVLLGPSRYLHDYLRARGWQLPERVHVQPYALPSAVRSRKTTGEPSGGAHEPSTGLPSEIVFFGRLETRKGVATLCDALDLLASEGELPSFTVTFLGPVAQVLGEPADAYIGARAARWPWRWQIVSDRDQQGAAEYLARPGVLAVMPSLVDNAPNTVSEAVALGIPLVAGRAGGTGELVAAEQRDDHMFGDAAEAAVTPLPLGATVPWPDPRPLAALLRRRLTTPVEPARPPADPTAVDAAYDRWHRAVAKARRSSDDARDSDPSRQQPTLAACVLFDGDEQLLTAQLDALAGDDVELVVADLRDAAEEPPAAAGEREARVVRPATAGHAAAARAAAVAATAAELVVLVPPGDVPLPSLAATLRRAAATGADVYGCVVLDERDGAAAGEDPAVHAFVPLPGPALAGLTHPAFTAGPYAIRRAALARLGGFPADARGDEVDHELLNRAAVAGMAIEVVPEPLAAKRRPDRWSTFRAVWPHTIVEPPYDAAQWLRAERPFADDDGDGGGARPDLVGLLRGARADAQRFEGDLHGQHDVYEDRIAQHRTWIADLQAEVAQLRAENIELRKSTVRHTIRVLRDRARRVRR